MVKGEERPTTVHARQQGIHVGVEPQRATLVRSSDLTMKSCTPQNVIYAVDGAHLLEIPDARWAGFCVTTKVFWEDHQHPDRSECAVCCLLQEPATDFEFCIGLQDFVVSFWVEF